MITKTEESGRLAEENLGLVHLCANRFRGKGIEYDDLYGAGCIGLMVVIFSDPLSVFDHTF
mgnify:CR=1 FL=1